MHIYIGVIEVPGCIFTGSWHIMRNPEDRAVAADVARYSMLGFKLWNFISRMYEYDVVL